MNTEGNVMFTIVMIIAVVVLGLQDKLSIFGNILLTIAASKASNSLRADRAKVML